MPDRRIEEPRRQQGRQIRRRQQGDLSLRVQQCGYAVVHSSRRPSQRYKNKLKQNQQHSRKADKQERMPQVGNAPRRRHGILSEERHCARRAFEDRRFIRFRRVFGIICAKETHADLSLWMEPFFFAAFAGVLFADSDFPAAFFSALASRAEALAARADGRPVFFSRAMNLPRTVFARSGAAAMSSGCGPA